MFFTYPNSVNKKSPIHMLQFATIPRKYKLPHVIPTPNQNPDPPEEEKNSPYLPRKKQSHSPTPTNPASRRHQRSKHKLPAQARGNHPGLYAHTLSTAHSRRRTGGRAASSAASCTGNKFENGRPRETRSLCRLWPLHPARTRAAPDPSLALTSPISPPSLPSAAAAATPAPEPGFPRSRALHAYITGLGGSVWSCIRAHGGGGGSIYCRAATRLTYACNNLCVIRQMRRYARAFIYINVGVRQSDYVGLCVGACVCVRVVHS